MIKKLNLGCGYDIKKGYINLDNANIRGVNIKHDLNNLPLPFKDKTFNEIYCNSILEHFIDIRPLMKELYRISEKGAKIIIFVPYYNSQNAFHDPTHKSYFSYDSFNYFTKENWYNDIEHRFKLKKVKAIGFRLLPQTILKKISKYIPNLVTAIYFELEV